MYCSFGSEPRLSLDLLTVLMPTEPSMMRRHSMATLWRTCGYSSTSTPRTTRIALSSLRYNFLIICALADNLLTAQTPPLESIKALTNFSRSDTFSFTLWNRLLSVKATSVGVTPEAMLQGTHANYINVYVTFVSSLHVSDPLHVPQVAGIPAPASRNTVLPLGAEHHSIRVNVSAS